MPVPSLITDLSTTAASNSPAGSESPTDGDNYLRALSAFIAQIYSGAVNITLGDASGDTITVNAGIVACPNGLNFDSNTFVIDATNNNLANGTATPSFADGGGIVIYRSTTPRLQLKNSTTGDTSGVGGGLALSGVDLYVENREAGVLYFNVNGATRSRIDSSGNTIPTLTATPPSLGVNLQMVANLTSNTNLRFSVRGSDGTTRVANITLA